MTCSTLLNKILKTSSKTNGFSIIEVVLVIGIIAMLATAGSPNVTEYFDVQRVQEEKLSMKDAEKAIISRIKADGVLFDVATMQDVADEIAGSTNRVEREVLKDVWRNDRYIISITEDEFVSGDVLEVHSLVVYSFGVDNCPGELKTCTEANRTQHIANFKTKLTDLNSGGSSSAVIDTASDIYIYISDREERVGRYKDALNRLDRLQKSLSEYSKLRLNENLALGTANAAGLTHYPPSLYSGDLTGYATKVRADASTSLAEAGGNGTQLYNGIPGVRTPTVAQIDLDKFRARQGMIALTQILGLPASNCCNALSKFTYSGETYETPFYYYSRPGRLIPSTGNCFYKNNFPATISVNKRASCWGQGMP